MPESDFNRKSSKSWLHLATDAGLLISGRKRHVRALRTFVSVLNVYRRTLKVARQNDQPQEQALERSHELGAQKVVQLCRKNGASWVKAAQFFSCRPDVVPPAYIQQLQTLQNDAPPVPFRDIEPALTEEYGSDWRCLFEHFDETPVATASIAQVHRATLKSGDEVAVKVRLPGVTKLFRQDEVTFKAVARMVSPLVKEIDVVQVVQQLLSMTMSELDLRDEADNLKRFSAYTHHPRVRLPRLFDMLSSERILVTGWVEGLRLPDYLNKHPEQASVLLPDLLQSYIQQVTSIGMYQADPHPGNFIVDEDGIITILDFGALAELTPDEVVNYSALLFGVLSGSATNIVELFENAGFKGGNPEVLKTLAEYMLTDKLNRSDLSSAISDMMMMFSEQRIQMPDSYVSVARVLITVGGFLMSYQVPFQLTTDS